jgi:hypothetical protein
VVLLLIVRCGPTCLDVRIDRKQIRRRSAWSSSSGFFIGLLLSAAATPDRDGRRLALSPTMLDGFVCS